jgi:hypothetical protein
MEPVLITADDDGEQYIHDHVRHFFDTTVYKNINSLSQFDRQRYFKMVTDHEKLINKLYGNLSNNSIISLPNSLRNNVDDKLVKEYKLWLEAQ